MTKQKIKTVTLNPDVWCRNLMPGENTSLLFHVDGRRQQCCIGVACTVLGIADDVIRGKEYATSLASLPRLPRAIRVLSKTRSMKVYSINDLPGSPDSKRVTELNAELRAAKVPLRFRLGKSRAATKGRDAKRAVPTSASEAP